MVKLLGKLFIKDYQNYQNPLVRAAYGKLSGIVGIISNLLLCALKIITGFLIGSFSYIADGINNLSDAGSSIVTLIGFKLASEPADADHPFGHQRVEYLTGLIVSFIIIAIGIILLKSSIESIFNPEAKANFSVMSAIILAISIIIKCLQSIFYRRVGKLINSTAVLATSIDSLNDCISTGAVLIASIISIFTDLSLDGYMGCLVSLFILYSGYKLVKEAMSPLIGEKPSKELVDQIVEKVLSYPKVLGIHDLVIHSYGPGKIFATIHVEVDSEESILVTHDEIDNIEQDFRENLGINLVIHMDPIDTKDEVTLELKEEAYRILQKIDPKLNFHDFRIVKGETHINVLFDVLVPIRYQIDDDDLKKMIDLEFKKYKIGNNCVINTVLVIDHDYNGGK
ncbi:MAG: cation transporter [Bacilli bacterium]|nr:cation transporter [Bacilli bacterium]